MQAERAKRATILTAEGETPAPAVAARRDGNE